MEADVWFEPELVIEVVASEITISPIHKAAKIKSERIQVLLYDFQNLQGRSG